MLNPDTPLPNSSHDKAARLLQAETNIFIEVAIAISAMLDFINLPLLPSFFVKSDRTYISTVKPDTPAPICCGSSPDSFLQAAANISTENDIVNITLAAFAPPDILPLVFENIANDPIRSANITVTAPNDLLSFSLSISERTTRDAARIPIAMASFIRTSAFNCV